MAIKKILAVGKKILETEIKGLNSLKKNLNNNFSIAVNLILENKKK